MTASRCAALADLKLPMAGTPTRTALFHDPGYPATEAMDAEQRKLTDEFNDRIADGKVLELGRGGGWNLMPFARADRRIRF